MVIKQMEPGSKVAARIIKEAGRINRNMFVTIGRRAPESTILTGKKPATGGWKIIEDIPRNGKGRNDYIALLKTTPYNEIYIRLGTNGGSPKVYGR